MTDAELDKLKAEIGYHTICKPCRACGECEKILEMALKELRESRETPRPCDSCKF